MSSSLSLRPISPADEEFLVALYGSTRAAELARLDWDEGQKAAFVRQQFTAQHRYYQQQYPDATFQVILVEEHPAGRLYLDEAPGATRIIDIALLPEYRGQGVGTGLVTAILARAEGRNAPVTIHVERDNPARRWYTRLGFGLVEDEGFYLLLRWLPPLLGGSKQSAGASEAGPSSP